MAPAFVRQILPKQSRRGNIARAAIGRATYRGNPARALADYADQHPRVTFVQIGSHDGTSGDPLAVHLEHHPGWAGTLVEPIPEFFDELTRLRGDDPRFRLVRAAITPHAEPTIEMTAVRTDAGLPEWTRQLASIRSDVLLRHAEHAPGLEDNLDVVTVPALTFDELMGDTVSVDLIHIDTEGHDAAVLELIDFDRWDPDLVLFEHKHLDRGITRAWRRRLRRRGYKIEWNELDTISVR